MEVKEESVKADVTTLGRYCMTKLPLLIIQSSTNKMMVTFYSDHVISAKGFNASYTSVPATVKGIISLRTFALIVSVHLYCARKFTRHVMHASAR